VPDDVLPLFYNVADVFVSPSLYEGFGLPLVEAMACGIPVICSDIEVFREVAGNAALFVNAQDVEMWADVLTDCLRASYGWRREHVFDVSQDPGSSGDLGSLIIRGRRRVQALSHEAEARTMLSIYQRYARVWRGE
jgi:glycosyltransferase involved in cell wall biosynthesis